MYSKRHDIFHNGGIKRRGVNTYSELIFMFLNYVMDNLKLTYVLGGVLSKEQKNTFCTFLVKNYC